MRNEDFYSENGLTDNFSVLFGRNVHPNGLRDCFAGELIFGTALVQARVVSQGRPNDQLGSFSVVHHYIGEHQ